MSPLYVADTTKLLTNEGYRKVADIVGSPVEAWDGDKWCKLVIENKKTIQDVIRITMSNGTFIDCSTDTTFSIKQGSKYVSKSISELQVGDIIEPPLLMPVVCQNSVEVNVPIKPNTPPHGERIFPRLLWLSNMLDKEAGLMQITSDDLSWLQDIQFMCHTLSVSPFILQTPRGYHLRFSSKDCKCLIDGLMLPTTKTVDSYHACKHPRVSIASIEKTKQSHNVYRIRDDTQSKCVINGILC